MPYQVNMLTKDTILPSELYPAFGEVVDVNDNLITLNLLENHLRYEEDENKYIIIDISNYPEYEWMKKNDVSFEAECTLKEQNPKTFYIGFFEENTVTQEEIDAFFGDKSGWLIIDFDNKPKEEGDMPLGTFKL